VKQKSESRLCVLEEGLCAKEPPTRERRENKERFRKNQLREECEQSTKNKVPNSCGGGKKGQ